MTYNLSGLASNSTTFLGFVQEVNRELTFGFLGVGILLAIAYISFEGYFLATADAKKSITASVFLSTICSIILSAAQLLNDIWVYGCLIALALSLATLWKEG